MLRISGEPILLKCTSARPDVLLLIDPTIWHHANVLLGVSEGATLIFNSTHSPEAIDADLRSGRHGYRLELENYRLLVVDGTGIARRCLGRPIPNTAMMGALAEATGLVGQQAMEASLQERFGSKADVNIQAVRAARKALVEL
jgi:2-oxoacid:acceptor oxidoreductase gamma subunit (pyruvate/2-ketoisovalerate family)